MGTDGHRSKEARHELHELTRINNEFAIIREIPVKRKSVFIRAHPWLKNYA
jgi:hypothetical protein